MVDGVIAEYTIHNLGIHSSRGSRISVICSWGFICSNVRIDTERIHVIRLYRYCFRRKTTQKPHKTTRKATFNELPDTPYEGE